MISRIKKLLCLENHGKTIRVKGPIDSWQTNEVSAIVSVIITQMKSNGKIAVARGISEQYLNGATDWDADATVTTGPALEFGPAVAYAVATIEYTNQTFKPYDWTVQVRLVDCSDGEPDQPEG